MPVTRYTFSSPLTVFAFPSTRFAQFSAVFAQFSAVCTVPTRWAFTVHVTRFRPRYVFAFPSTRCPVFCCFLQFRTCCPFTLHVFVPVNRIACFRPRVAQFSAVPQSSARVARCARSTFSSPLTVFAFPSTRCPVFCCFAQFRTCCPFTLHVFVPVHVLPVSRSRVARFTFHVFGRVAVDGHVRHVSRLTVFAFPSTRCPVFCCFAQFRARVACSRYTFSSRLTVFAFPSTRCPVFCCFAQFRTRCPFTLHVFVPVNRFRVSVHALPSFLLFRTVPHVLPVHVTRYRPRSRVARSRSRVARSRYTFSSPLTVGGPVPRFRPR